MRIRSRQVKSSRPRRPFVRKGKFSVYILSCGDGSYYTGSTKDLKKRIALHRSGRGAKYTRMHRPLRLVWHKDYRYFKLAFLEELRIKTLTRRQKELLVASGHAKRVKKRER